MSEIKYPTVTVILGDRSVEVPFIRYQLVVAKSALKILAVGMKIRHLNVKKIAAAIGAPQQRWTAVKLLEYVENVLNAESKV